MTQMKADKVCDFDINSKHSSPPNEAFAAIFIPDHLKRKKFCHCQALEQTQTQTQEKISKKDRAPNQPEENSSSAAQNPIK